MENYITIQFTPTTAQAYQELTEDLRECAVSFSYDCATDTITVYLSEIDDELVEQISDNKDIITVKRRYGAY